MCATSQQYHSMLHLFFFNDTATTEIYTLSLHDALPISGGGVLADRVAQFAMAAREALASGIAVNNPAAFAAALRSEEHTSELQSRLHLVCRLLLEKKKNYTDTYVAIISPVVDPVAAHAV